MPQSMILPVKYLFDHDNKPLAFGKVYAYETGTTTPKDTYDGESGAVNPNPVILNAEGYGRIYLDGTYSIVVDDQNDVNVWSEDPVSSNASKEWTNCSSPTYISPSSFSLSGDRTDQYEPGRVVRIDNNVAEYSYSTIDTVVFGAGVTTVSLGSSSVEVTIIGVCASIIGRDSISKNIAKKVDSIQELRMLPSPTTGDTVLVTGYYSSGDYGGGTFYWNTTSPDADDGGITILPTGHVGAGRWKRTETGVMTFRQFGAVGDRIVDDSAAIQSALDNAPGILLSTQGWYRVMSTLNGNSDQILVGAGGVITTDDNSFITCLSFSDKKNITVDGLIIEGPSVGDGFDFAIDIGGAVGCDNVLIQNCRISDIGQELAFPDEYGTAIQIGGGVTTSPPSPTNGSSNVKILNNTITDIKGFGEFRGDGVSVRTARNVLIDGNNIDTVRRQNIAVIEASEDIKITNNSLINGYLSGIDIEPNSAPTSTESIIISGNTIRNYGSKPGATIGSQFYGIALFSNEWEKCIVTDNIITAVSANSLEAIHCRNNSKYAVISGNIIDCGGVAPAGIIMFAGSGFEDMVVSDNIVINFTERGIWGDDNEEMVCTGNLVKSSDAGVLEGIAFTSAGKIICSDNVVDIASAVIDDGIRIQGLSQGSVTGNNVSVSSGIGLNIKKTTGTTDAVTISDNVVVDSSGVSPDAGIVLAAGGAALFENVIGEGNSVKGFASKFAFSGPITYGQSVQFSNTKYYSDTGPDFSNRASGAAATNVNKVLTDYEDGTWDCEFADAESGGNVASLGALEATYVRIGRQVTLFLEARDINTAGMTAGNVLIIRGLPFPASSVPRASAAGSCVLDKMTTGLDYVNARIFWGKSHMTLTASARLALGDIDLLVSDVASAGSDVQALTITYFTNA